MNACLVAVAAALALASAAEPQPLGIPSQIQERSLIYAPEPVYPSLARQMRVEGAVRLAVLIAPNGRVDAIRLISGHPLLVKAVMDAVKQWHYLPTIRNRRRMAVVTTVEVTFRLRALPSHGPPEEAARV